MLFFVCTAGNILVRVVDPNSLWGRITYFLNIPTAPRLVLLDAGMTAELTRQDQMNLVKFFRVSISSRQSRMPCVVSVGAEVRICCKRFRTRCCSRSSSIQNHDVHLVLMEPIPPWHHFPSLGNILQSMCHHILSNKSKKYRFP